jgi:hypothetical protein
MYNNNSSLLPLNDTELQKEEHAKKIKPTIERLNNQSEKKYNEFVKNIKVKKTKSKKK